MTIYIIGWLWGTSSHNFHEHMFDGHDSFTHRRFMHARPSEIQLEAGRKPLLDHYGSVSGRWVRTTRCAVYQGVFNGSSSYFVVKDRASLQSIKGNPGTHSHRGFNLGKQYRYTRPSFGANMFVLEVLYYEAAHTRTPREVVERYANHTYQMNKW